MDEGHQERQQEWSHGHLLAWIWALFIGLGLVRLLVTDREDLFSVAISVLWVLGGAVQLAMTGFRSVTATQDGLVIRRALWQKTFVPWDDVADIRSEKDRPGYPLAVFTRDGSVIQTGLHPVEHRSLPRHWRAVTDGHPPD
jgi:hypothetical protein